MECGHSIRKQRISLAMENEEQALALHSRLSELNQKQLLPTLERVLDEFTVTGQKIKINKLDIDLGLLSFNTFDQQLTERFESVLREVMEQTVNNFAGNSNTVIEPEKLSQLQLLEYYLVQGALPWHARQRNKFSCESLFMELATQDWPALMELIKKHSHMHYVIERIVVQLQEHSLRRFMQLLEPKQGVLIVTYLVDMNTIQMRQRILPLHHSAYHRLLWVLALTYSINERGSQFNRRSFVKTMLENMAHKEGLNYVQLLDMFHMGLLAAEKIQPMQSSLPAVIATLVREQQRKSAVPLSDKLHPSDEILQDTAIAEALARLEYYLNTGLSPPQVYDSYDQVPSLNKILKYLGARASSQLVIVLRRLASQSKPGLSLLIERLLKAFTPIDLLTILASHEKVLIDTWVNLLISSHNESNSRPAMTNYRVAWEAVLQYLIKEASTPWQAREMVEKTLATIARHMGVTTTTLVLQLQPILNNHANGPVKEVLSQALAVIDDESPSPATMEIPAQQLFASYDHIELLMHFLKYGVLPWYQLLRNPDLTPQECISRLLNLSYYRLRTVLSFVSRDQQRDGLLRMVQLLSDSDLKQLLNKMLSANSSGAKNKGDHFTTAVLNFADVAKHKASFYTQLFVGLLNHESIDLEMIATGSQLNCEFPDDPGDWHRDQLQSVLIWRLQNHQLRAKLQPSSLEIFRTLVENHPKASCSLMMALYESPELVGELLSHSPAGLVDQLLERLQPTDAPTLKALIVVFATIAAPYRPRLEDLRRVIVNEALYLEHPLGENFFSRVLQQLFPGTLADPLKQHLLKSVAAWAAIAKLPVMHIGSFKAAISDVVTGQLPDEESSRTVISATESQNHGFTLKEQVFAMLLVVAPAKSAGPVELSKEQLQQAMIELFEQSPQMLCTFIHKHIDDAKVRDHWIKILPESSLVRIAWLLQPQQLRALLDSAEILAAAWLDCAPSNHPELTGRAEYWRFMLQFFAQHTGANCTLSALTAAFFKHFTSSFSIVVKNIDVFSDTDKVQALDIAEKLRENASRLAHKAGHNQLLNLLQKEQYGLSTSRQQQAIPAANEKLKTTGTAEVVEEQMPKSKPWLHPAYEDEKLTEGETYYVDNAGLVLLGVFLPHLFKHLDMLVKNEEEGSRLRDSETITRAVHLLQYFVDGSTDTPEPSLILNKIMCGVPLNCVVENRIDLTEEESAICKQLFNAVLNRWESIKNTSIEGLQQTFLQREGKLVKTNEGWALTVQRKTVDVLVDQIPWRVSIVSQAWMDYNLFVKW